MLQLRIVSIVDVAALVCLGWALAGCGAAAPPTPGAGQPAPAAEATPIVMPQAIATAHATTTAGATATGALAGAAPALALQPTPAQCPQGCTRQEDGCNIKGKIDPSSGARIYYLPDDPSHSVAKMNTFQGERWFCTVEEAEANGWRRAPRLGPGGRP